MPILEVNSALELSLAKSLFVHYPPAYWTGYTWEYMLTSTESIYQDIISKYIEEAQTILSEMLIDVQGV